MWDCRHPTCITLRERLKSDRKLRIQTALAPLCENSAEKHRHTIPLDQEQRGQYLRLQELTYRRKKEQTLCSSQHQRLPSTIAPA